MKKFLMMLLSLVTVVSTSIGLVACGEDPIVEFKNGDKSETVYADKDFAAPADPVKEGYTFLGWFEAGSDTKFDFSVTPDKDTVLEARWQVNKYKITFDADGGSAVEEIEQDFGTEVKAPANPTKKGYDFAGWYNGETKYEFKTIEAKNVTLKAKWNLAPFSIEFDSDGGSQVATITKNFGENVTAPADPTKEGHTFAGWFEEGASTAYVFDKIEARPVSLKAKWQVNQYTINFNVDGGSAVDAITQDFGTAVSAPNSTKNCYTLAGWYETDPEVLYTFDTIEARTVNLTAKWTPVEYTIDVDVNDGTVADFSQIKYTIESEDITFPQPEKEDSRFIGWFGVKVVGGVTYYVGADYLAGTGNPVTNLSDASLSEANAITGIDCSVFAANEEYRDIKLIAKWLGDEFAITYNVNGGNALDNDTQIVRYGEEYNLVVPTHPQGYEFAGWFISGNPDPIPSQGAMPSRSFEVVAGWTQTYEVTYALYKHNAEYNGRVAITEDLVLDGYNNLTRAQIDEAKGAIEKFKDGDILEIELANSNNIYVVAKVKVITAVISTAEELSKMILLSVDEVPTGTWGAWGGYYVLTKDIDMAGKAISKNTMPDSRPTTSGPSFGFYGTIDGNGHTIVNLDDMMFNQLGNWSATIKNLSFYNLSKPLANGLGCLTIENCYIDYTINNVVKKTVKEKEEYNDYYYNHLIGGTFGDADHARTFIMKDTVIKVTNNTEMKFYVVNNFIGNSNITIDNVILVGDSDKVEFSTTQIASGVTAIGLNDAYTGDVSGFDASIWDTTGNHPTFKGFSVTTLDRPYYYGRYILDRENGNAQKINDQDFVATVAEGVTVTIDKSVFNIGADGSNASPGYKWNVLAKGSDGKYYKIYIEFAIFVINDAVDLANIAKGINVSSWSTGFGESVVIAFNNDIDMTGVTMVNSGAEGAYAGAWGFKGTILGNGRTISNLNTTLIYYINSAATIKDLNFKNMGANGAIAYKSSGVQLVNVNFDIDAFGMSKVYLVNKTTLSRTATTLTNCSINIKNASSSFVCYVDYGPNPDYDKGTITLNNVTVSMNDGAFKLASSEDSTGDLTGAQSKTVVNAVLDKTAATPAE